MQDSSRIGTNRRRCTAHAEENLKCNLADQRSSIWVDGLGLVDLLDSWATCTGAWRSTSTTKVWHATVRHAPSTCSLVDLHHDGIHHTFELLLFGLEFILLCQLVLVEPVQSILHSFLDGFLVASLKLVLELFLL